MLERSAAEKELIYLTTTVIELLNARSFSNPWFKQHVSPNVRLDVQGRVQYGLEAFTGNYQNDAGGSKNFKVDVENATAIVDEKQGCGTVILSQYLRSFPADERKMAGTILMKWSLTGGQWICQTVIMMFGTPEFLL